MRFDYELLVRILPAAGLGEVVDDRSLAVRFTELLTSVVLVPLAERKLSPKANYLVDSLKLLDALLLFASEHGIDKETWMESILQGVVLAGNDDLLQYFIERTAQEPGRQLTIITHYELLSLSIKHNRRDIFLLLLRMGI